MAPMSSNSAENFEGKMGFRTFKSRTRSNAHRHLFLLLVACILPAITGCSLFSSGVDEDFKRASRKYADYTSPMLRGYIDADASLDLDSKRIRKQPIDEYEDLLKEAEKED